MRALGHTVDVIACGSGPGALRVGGKLFGGEGAPERLEQNPLLYVDALKATLRLQRAVSKQLSAWDGVIAHWLVPSALCAALSTSIPITAVAHSGDVHLIKKLRIGRALAPLWTRRISKFVFVSNELKELFLSSVGRASKILEPRCEVTPMGIHSKLFECSKPNDKKEIILCVARLVDIKGVDRLVSAARYMTSNAEILIAGDGPKRAELEASADDKIQFTGALAPHDRHALFKKAKVVVVPSRRRYGRGEGAPMVIREALAASARVVVSQELSGSDRDDVVSVDAANPKTLASALERALLEPWQVAQSLYEMDWNVVGQRLLPT